jgi:hypothetical protein
MPALGRVGKKAELGETPEIVALAVMFRALYHCLPQQSMVRNAAELHYSQPVISQYLNGKRIPSKEIIVTTYSKAAAEDSRTDGPGLPCPLARLLEMRIAAKASLRKARAGQTSGISQTSDVSAHESAGKIDRRNG